MAICVVCRERPVKQFNMECEKCRHEISEDLTEPRRYHLYIRGLQEDLAWSQFVERHILGVTTNAYDVLDYSFHEILNNAIEHSEGERAHVLVNHREDHILIIILDDGIGIFDKIYQHKELESRHAAILELSKGKLTTDPERHTGEGIFFTSRACDVFGIKSKGLTFNSRKGRDWLFDEAAERRLLEDESNYEPVDLGTAVFMIVSKTHEEPLSDVFNRYTASDDDFGFSRTRVPILLAEYGEGLTSRSKARRLLNRIERFQEVIFDFEGVRMMSPSFADEVFRVFQKRHPEVNLQYENASDHIERMIKKAQAQLEEER